MHLTAYTLMHILDDSRTRKHLEWFSSRGVGLDTQYSRMDVLIVMFQAMLCFIDEETVRRGARTISTRWHGWTLCRVSYTFLCSGEKGTRTLRELRSPFMAVCIWRFATVQVKASAGRINVEQARLDLYAATSNLWREVSCGRRS